MRFCRIVLIFLFPIVLISCGGGKNKQNVNTERIRWEKILETTGRQIFSWHVDKNRIRMTSLKHILARRDNTVFIQRRSDRWQRFLKDRKRRDTDRRRKVHRQRVRTDMQRTHLHQRSAEPHRPVVVHYQVQ